MPSGEISVLCQDQQLPDQQVQQTKFCSACSLPLVDPASSPFLLDPDAAVCTGCHEHNVSPCPTLVPQPDNHIFCTDIDSDYSIRQTAQETSPSSRRIPDTLPISVASSDPPHSYHSTLIAPPIYSNKPASLTVNCTVNNTHHHQTTTKPFYQAVSPRRQANLISSPLTDITRLRVRSQGHHCLYPGATFQGTQKSGRNSYDVNVTIVDVDFASSFLCGYLRIRGLTDDWPELTTYFDAEIIGARHGFLTQNWGASEQEDMVHWSRFPAFKYVKPEMKKPHFTIDNRDRGAVFMRWKERFLVPDHRVQDINGASFAGFYYVCVDFNPPATTTSTIRSMSQQMPLTSNTDDMDMYHQQSSLKSENPQRTRRDSSVRRRAPSIAPLAPPVATMSGFYYHQNSEPYQQLSLCHVPERSTSTFEFR